MKVSQKVIAQRRRLVEEMAEAMERDGLAYLAPFAQLPRPRNGKTGRAYSGRNIAHLYGTARRNSMTDPRWYTFPQVKALGGRVRRGEVSTMIEKWDTSLMKVGEDGDGNETYTCVPVFVCTHNLFNGSQVDGIEEWPGINDGLDDERTASVAERLIASSRCPIVEGADECYYSPSEDTIHLASRRLYDHDDSSSAFMRIALHEMAHSTMVPLRRKVGGHFGSPEYAFEELIAELTAVMVASELGFPLDFDSENDRFVEQHAYYLRHWKKHIADNSDTLFTAAAKAGKAADYIIDRYHRAP